MAASTRAAFIIDDNIGLDQEHMLEVCDLLAFLNKRKTPRMVFLQLSAQSIVQFADNMDRMKAAGLHAVFVGFETMSRRDLKNVSKPSSPSVNKEAAHILRANRIGIVAGCIFGFPDDDAATIQESFRAIIDLRPDVIYPQFLTPYPGTELREEMAASDLIESNDFSRYDGYTCNTRTKHLSNNELRTALHKEILKSFFNPKMLWGNHVVGQHPSLVIPFLSNLTRLAVNLLKKRDFPRQEFDFRF
jgi:radical SAM superfamily enzyme YgiQ (UPF0313 family)